MTQLSPTTQGVPAPPRRPASTLLAIAALGCISPLFSMAHDGNARASSAEASLEETRILLGKWIETQQIIAKERNEWQQGKEVLLSRIDLAKKEVAALEDSLKKADAGVAETAAKRKGLDADNDKLKATAAELATSVAAMESEVRRLFKMLPDPIQQKIQPLYQRIPEDPTNTRVTVAERFQNVLGILNEVNKDNNEITVNFEVRTLADGKPSEVRAMYLGLAQGYYVSTGGEAGIGHPGPDGWTWEPSKALASDVLTALDIIQGKHTPAFVPLPVKLQ